MPLGNTIGEVINLATSKANIARRFCLPKKLCQRTPTLFMKGPFHRALYNLKLPDVLFARGQHNGARVCAHPDLLWWFIKIAEIQLVDVLNNRRRTQQPNQHHRKTFVGPSSSVKKPVHRGPAYEVRHRRSSSGKFTLISCQQHDPSRTSSQLHKVIGCPCARDVVRQQAKRSHVLLPRTTLQDKSFYGCQPG